MNETYWSILWWKRLGGNKKRKKKKHAVYKANNNEKRRTQSRDRHFRHNKTSEKKRTFCVNFTFISLSKCLSHSFSLLACLSCLHLSIHFHFRGKEGMRGEDEGREGIELLKKRVEMKGRWKARVSDCSHCKKSESEAVKRRMKETLCERIEFPFSRWNQLQHLEEVKCRRE